MQGPRREPPGRRPPRVPADELQLSFTRSGGPGGQHANTSDTKVQLRFDIGASRALTDAEKSRLRDALGSRINRSDQLVLEASEHRSQTRNREAVLGRFHHLVDDALRPPRVRRPTRKPRSADRRRLEEKRRQAEKKRLRSPPP